MRYFFKSRRFKIAASLISVVLILSIVFTTIGGFITPQTSVLGAIISPFQSAFTAVADYIKSESLKISGNEKLIRENSELKRQIDELQSKIVGYDEAVEQNEFLKEYLEIKENHTDYEFEEALLIARDNDDPFGSFTVNKGSLQGVSLYDPVITSAGLIGYISEVGTTFSKVATVLSPDIKIAAFDRRTSDTGIINGSLSAVKKDCTQMDNLSRSCSLAIGDYIVTSGGGVFPNGMLIGTVSEIGTDYNNSIYAYISPCVDLSDISNVMIITYFSGQSNLS